MVLYECKRCGYSTPNKSYIRKHLLRKKKCNIVLQNISIPELYLELLGEPYPGQKMLQNNTLASTFCQHLDTERQRFVNTRVRNITNGELKPKKCYENSDSPVNLQTGSNNVTKQRQRFVNTSVRNITNGEIKAKKCYEKKHSTTNLQNDSYNVTKQRQPFVNTCNSEGEISRNKCYKKTDLGVNLHNDNNDVTQNVKSIEGLRNLEGEITSNNYYEKSDIPVNLHNEKSKTSKTSKTSNLNISNLNNLGKLEENHYNITNKNLHKVNKLSNIEEVLINDCESNDMSYYKSNILSEFREESELNYDDDMLYECSYCNRSFTHRQGRHRHEKNCNSRKVLENRCTRLEMKLEQKEEAINQLRTQLEKLFDKVGKGEVHNHNTTNYTYNIILNAFGSENTSYIDDVAVKRVLQQGTMSSIPKLLELIHFHPEHEENHNVRITNKKENTANLWDGNKWVLKRRPDVIEEMSDKAFNLINEHYEDGSNTNIDEFKNKYDKNDKDMKKRVHKETELMIINNKKN